MTIAELIKRLQDEADYLPNGLMTNIGFATSPQSTGEILLIYYAQDTLWIDLG